VSEDCDEVSDVSKHETPLTRGYWRTLGEGTLYEEFPVVRARAGVQSRRNVDGLVVLGGSHRIASRDEHGALSLDDEDVVIIQTKATYLNPYVFGQALLSADLVRMRWTPRSIRSVLVCAADDPELRPFVDQFRDVEVHVAGQPPRSRFGLQRVPGAVAGVACGEGMRLLAPAQLTSRLQIDGVQISAARELGEAPVAQLVNGHNVVSIHSEAGSRGPKIPGMWIAGEVILAQAMLSAMGAASATSLIVCRHGDKAIEDALSGHAAFEVMPVGSGPAGERSSPGDGTSRPTRVISLPRISVTAAARARDHGSPEPRPTHVLDGDFIPGHYCRACGWPFTTKQRRTRCQSDPACRRRQQIPLSQRGSDSSDRVHPEWLALQQRAAATTKRPR
jgi:hypothetical protein